MVRDLDPMNDLTYLRVRSNKTEILVAPGMGEVFAFVTDFLSGYQILPRTGRISVRKY